MCDPAHDDSPHQHIRSPFVRHHTLLQLFFFFNDTATTEIYPLSLHDALPISAPWQMAHRMVLPSAPVVTISSPFLTLPVGTWATKPERGSRLSAERSFCGNSMMRLPSGSVPPCSSGKRMAPLPRYDFDTVSLSTTLYQTGYFIAAKYSAAALKSSSLSPLAIGIIATARAPLRAPLLNSFIWRTMYPAGSPETPADSGCPPPLVRWQSAQARAFVSLRPCATTSGIGAWSCGYQSGGLNPSSIWAWV